jgi:hypothetical protein
MNVFLDCEFSDIARPLPISIGLVAENGSELYVEVDGWAPSDCSDFVKAVVLPLLGPTKVSRGDAGRQLQEFLLQFEHRVIWSDAPHHDLRILEVLVPLLPRNSVRVLQWDDQVRRKAYTDASEALFARGLARHHALNDARAMLEGWRAVQKLRVPEALDGLSPDFASRLRSPPV